MKKDRSLGLDELMIVNPGDPVSAVGTRSGRVFLGEDGALYEVHGLNGIDPGFTPGEYFLGQDGTLFQVVGRLPRHLFRR